MADNPEENMHTSSGDCDLEPKFSLVCQLCSEDGETIEASGYCQDCGVYLCQRCIRHHKRLPISNDHYVLDKDNMPNVMDTASAKAVDVCSENCPEHNGEIIKYFCSDHSYLGCSACVTLQHKTCNNIYIPKCSNNFENDQEYIDLLKRIEQLEKKSVEMGKHSEASSKKADEIYKRVLEDVAKYKNDMINALENLEEALKQRAANLKAVDVEKMTAVSELSKQVNDELRSMNKTFEKLINSKQHCRLFTEVKRAKIKVDEFDSNLREYEPIAVNEYKFMELQDKDLLRKVENSASLARTKYIHEASIKVRTDTDLRKCDISGSVSLPGKKLVVTDSESKNSKIKVIDTHHGIVVEEIKMSSPPWDIALFQANKLVVTQPDAKKLAFFCIDSSQRVTAKSEIQLPSACYGVSSFWDNLAVTYKGPARVEIIDETGKTLQSFSKDDNGEALFSYPCNVAVSPDAQSVYVSDCDKHAVTCLGLDGKVKAIYKDGELSNPRNMAVNTAGIVYVCGRDSKNIHMLTPSLHKVAILLGPNDINTCPLSVQFCGDTDKLYVGRYNNDAIQVYKPV